MVKKLIAVALCLHSWAFAGSINLANISTATLNNGLKIIVKSDQRAPVFISQLWYSVGASDELRPLTGISHLLEHMMFKGTKAYEAGEFSRIIAKNGGTENAFTSKDYTAYYQKMQRSKLPLSIELEADRMRNLTFSEAELDKERQVVIEERRLRLEDNPNAQVYQQLSLISFAEEGVYHAPIIGFLEDIETISLSQLRHWYEQYYAPNNATLVVVGDVFAQEVVKLAQKYFGDYPYNNNIQPSKRSAIALKNQHKILKLPAELPFYAMAFHVPSLHTETEKNEAYQLEMLAYILDNGLSKKLIRQQQIASSISVGYRLYDKFSTLFDIAFVTAKGVDNQTVLQAIKTQAQELIANPRLIEAELKRTKAQLEANFVFAQDQISTQAYYLGMLSTVGLGADKLNEYVDKMNVITAKQVSTVAQKYLDFRTINTVELVPQGI